jgi:dynein heavy chain
VNNILGDIFISAACINYYGPFSGDYRRTLVAKWLAQCEEYSVPVTPGYTLADTIGDPMTIRDWNL